MKCHARSPDRGTPLREVASVHQNGRCGISPAPARPILLLRAAERVAALTGCDRRAVSTRGAAITAPFSRSATARARGSLIGMSYREHAPPPALAPWVQCSWQRSGDGGPPVRVVPDGCIDVVWIEGTGTQVVGPNTEAFLVALAARHPRRRRTPASGCGAGAARRRCRRRCATARLDRRRVGRRRRTPRRCARRRRRSRTGAGARRRDRAMRRPPARAARGRSAARIPAAAAPDPLVRAAVRRLARPHAAVAAARGRARRQRASAAPALRAGRRLWPEAPRARAATRTGAGRRCMPATSSHALRSTRATPISRTSRTTAAASRVSRRRRCCPADGRFRQDARDLRRDHARHDQRPHHDPPDHG